MAVALIAAAAMSDGGGGGGDGGVGVYCGAVMALLYNTCVHVVSMSTST